VNESICEYACHEAAVRRSSRATHRLRAAALTLLALLLATPTFASVIATREFKSAALKREWSYAVYLPTGYETSGLRYPVLYLLHGAGGNLNNWATLGGIQATADALMASGAIPPAIIVMPDAAESWYVDGAEKMETAVLKDLIPDVQRQFRAQVKREGRLIGGLSMGGYGALRFVLKYPEMFVAAALLSPAIYDPEPPPHSGVRRAAVFGGQTFDAALWRSLNYPMLWDAYLQKKSPVPMYINSGDDDHLLIEQEAAKLYALLRKNEQPAELRIVDGGHAWSVWESTIGDALRYIFRFAARPVLVE
jgi:S-formylglutathione hydrolase FrmB